MFSIESKESPDLPYALLPVSISLFSHGAKVETNERLQVYGVSAKFVEVFKQIFTTQLNDYRVRVPSTLT